MRKLAIVLAGMMVSGLAMAQITGSAHDFSNGEAWNTTGQICKVCHTPHGGDTTLVSPLWNHTLSAVASYGVYTSSTLETGASQPGDISKICLSCHDGTIALESFGGNGAATTTFVSGNDNLGSDLTNDHPVGFSYVVAQGTDGELNPTTSPLGSSTIAAYLFNDMMECATCHDVHNTGSVAGTQLLVQSNTSSGLCLACHAK